MPIAREGGFLLFPEARPGPQLGLESDMLADCIDECRSRLYPGVFGNPGFGFRERDLDCLRALPHLQAVWFWDVALDNVDGLYALPDLRSFGVYERPAVDFSLLPKLEALVWMHKGGDRQVESLDRLNDLYVWHFKPRSKSFADLQLLPDVAEMQILWANPPTLAGLKPNPKLRRLEIHRCRNLESLDLLPELYPALEHLVVDACGRIPAGEGARLAARLPALRHASVQQELVSR